MLKAFELHGQSMWPYLSTGDVIVTQTEGSMKKGQLYLFSFNNTNVVHRFIGNNEFKGDFNKNCEPIEGPAYVVLGREFNGKYINFNNPVSATNQILIGHLSRFNKSSSLFSKGVSFSIQIINRSTRWLENTILPDAKKAAL